MHRIEANKKVLIGLIISILVILAVGYIYWLKAYVPSQNAASPTPTPTQSNNEIPFPTPIVISPIPTPTDINTWINSSPNVNYQWTFKYPPNWREDAILKGFIYHPQELKPEDYNLSFFKVFVDWSTPELRARSTSVGNENTPVLKREVININGRDIELIFSEKINDEKVIWLRIQAYFNDIDFEDIVNEGKCYENGMLNIDVIYNNPPEFTIDDIPYEDDIKQMLTTFEITDCEPSN